VTTRFGLTKVKSGIILGVAYKPNIPDCRDTPALAIKRSFQELGISIDWHDPLVMQWDDETSTEIGNGQWDFGLIVTGHDALDLKSIKQRCGVVFDLTGRFISDHEIVQI
jgi:UDP-N-acetylglucosamine 2-epimerase (non-hydrolysing)